MKYRDVVLIVSSQLVRLLYYRLSFELLLKMIHLHLSRKNLRLCSEKYFEYYLDQSLNFLVLELSKFFGRGVVDIFNFFAN